MKRLFIIADAVAPTGFATVTHNLARHLTKNWDIHILGLNYFGDPHTYGYRIYPAYIGGDLYGKGRIHDLLNRIKPNVVFIINDPWIVNDYLEVPFNAPVVAYMPVDAPNIAPMYVQRFSKLAHVVTYTEFAERELRRHSFDVPTSVIPHGIDTNTFYPIPQNVARKKLDLSEDWFIVGNVNKNQPRKRLDLFLYIFSLFAKDKPENVKCYIHANQAEPIGWNIVQLAQYFGIENRLILTTANPQDYINISPSFLNFIYNTFNVFFSTTQGEGWGLTNMEAAACKIPQVVPKWSALEEWLGDGAVQVPCSSIYVGINHLNTVGGVIDIQKAVDALNMLYEDNNKRSEYAQRAYSIVTDPKYTWKNISLQFNSVFNGVLQNALSAKTTSD